VATRFRLRTAGGSMASAAHIFFASDVAANCCSMLRKKTSPPGNWWWSKSGSGKKTRQFLHASGAPATMHSGTHMCLGTLQSFWMYRFTRVSDTRSPKRRTFENRKKT